MENTIVNNQGVSLLSLLDAPPVKDSDLCAGLSAVFASGGPDLCDLHKSGTSVVHFDLVVPLTAVGGQDLACVFTIDPAVFLFPLIQAWPLPSRSGETLLLRKTGDSIEFLNELRHRKNTALSFRLPSDQRELIAAEALRRKNGIKEGVDYRGIPVLGAFRTIPGSPWYMVSKVDKDEILSPVRNFLKMLLLFTLALIACAVLFMMMMQRHRSAKHYKQLWDTEKSMRLLSARHEAILNTVPDIIAEVDMKKCYTWMNEAGRKFFGTGSIGRDASDYFKGEQETYAKVQPVFLGNPDVFYVESWQRRYDGEKRLLAWWCLSLRDANGNVTGALSTARDITEEKQHEDAIIAEKERFLVTLRSIGDGVITTDTSGNISFVNKVAEELTGYKQAEAVGRPLGEVFTIINEQTRATCENPVEKVLKSGVVVGLANHTALISKNGSERTIADSGAPIPDRESRIIGVVLVFRDVSDKQRTEDALNKADKLESIGILAGGIAHDFNNLLSGIYGYLDLAMEEVAADGKAADYLGKAVRTFTRAKDLTRQLLTFSKGGAPVRKTIRLGHLLREKAGFALSGSKVAPAFDIAPDLWSCDVDENQIGQVIDNIVINGVQAMPLGGTITVSAHNAVVEDGDVPLLKEGGYVKVVICDTGVGIPPSILPRIFDPFFTTKQKGNGLGLATVYSIIKKHDGEITVSSELDKGTTFTFFLPASKKHAAGIASVSGGPSARSRKGAGKVLIMDDEVSIRETAGEMLESMGYTPEFAQHGSEALAMVRAATDQKMPFTAVIMDLTIPGGMGGREAVALLRQTDKILKVFVASGYSNDPIMADPTAFGFTDKIGKPFRKGDLRELFGRYFPGQEGNTANS